MIFCFLSGVTYLINKPPEFTVINNTCVALLCIAIISQILYYKKRTTIVKVWQEIFILIVASATLAKDLCYLLKFLKSGLEYTKADWFFVYIFISLILILSKLNAI
jgi:hypothetical protein